MTKTQGAAGADRQYVVEVEPGNRSVPAKAGVSVLSVLHEAGLLVESSCGGSGTCGECRIRYVADPPEPSEADRAALAQDELDDGWRLACAHPVDASVRIELRDVGGELDHKARGPVLIEATDLDPIVRRVSVHPGARDRSDARPLAERLVRSGSDALPFTPAALRQVAQLPKEAEEVFLDDDGEKILRVGTTRSAPLYGIAIDIGTTTLAVHLFDLISGQRVGVTAARNPQRRFGADVISRIAHVRRHGGDGLEELHRAVIDGLNGLVSVLAEDSGVSREVIHGATIVGNPTMLHLLASVSPVGIDMTPFVPTFVAPIRCRADEIGLHMAENGVVVVLPSVSAYVGADIVGGILATRLRDAAGLTLFLDVGTNGEIVLARDGALIACSTAAGPAFEGASIVCGMAALDGAIEDVAIREDGIACSVIGDCDARGLCGTGLVSAVAELHAVGMIDTSGRFAESKLPMSNRLTGRGKDRRFRLTDGEDAVYLYQGDVREFQLAKASIRAGIEILLRRAEATAEEIDRVLIGGAFSGRLDAAHLVRTGLLPRLDVERVEVVGNTAGQGAALALLDRRQLARAVKVAGLVEYIELSADPAFSELYVGQMPFPEDEAGSRGSSVGRT